MILGLGATPNFIERITISLPNNVQNSDWHRQWTLLVPNSQVILIPHPPSQNLQSNKLDDLILVFIFNTRWILQLYLTPSTLIYMVSGVLLAVCVGLFVIVLLLHAREKVRLIYCIVIAIDIV